MLAISRARCRKYSQLIVGERADHQASWSYMCVWVTWKEYAGLYLTTKSVHMLEVDTSRGERISINLDITLPRMPCDWISVDAIDSSGRVQTDVDHDLKRQRLSLKGRKIQVEVKHDVGGDEELPDHLHSDASKLPAEYCGSSLSLCSCTDCFTSLNDHYQGQAWRCVQGHAMGRKPRKAIAATVAVKFEQHTRPRAG